MIQHKKRSILYVDDTVEQRYAMRRILETEGYAVLEAGTGKEALELMENTPALAVVDVRLPDINGYDLARRMKQMCPTLPLLQVSASFSDPILRASGLSGGADAYIAQPVHPSELIALVKRMLQTSEAEESLRFLAEIGPRITSTLSVPDAALCAREAVVPTFADACYLYLSSIPGVEDTLWLPHVDEEHPLRADMVRQATEHSVRVVHSQLLIAPLTAGQPGFGAVAFQLRDGREYTATDQVLAANLANRIGLALQNCILFATEKATRAALIQSEKLATAGRMSAAIAHEINNPLEALTNLIYILEQSPEATDSIREIATLALGEITRLAHITRQSLGFYRELSSPAALDLTASVMDTLELYQQRLESKSIQVKMDSGGPLLIRGIKGEIRQVISNLVVNAIESMETGGCLTLCTEARNHQAVMTVSDDGPGIPRSIVPRIFEAFYTTKQGTGTGLGLWITQNIVEKHNGTIEVSSNTDGRHGTSFEVRFPLCDAA